MGNQVVGIDVIASIEGLRKEFAEIPKVANKETAAMTAAVSKNIKELERAVAKAAKETKPAREEMGRFATAAGKAAEEATNLGDRSEVVGRNATKLAGALSLVSPEAGEVARNIADLADVGEVAATASAGLTAKVASLTPVLAIAAAGLASMVAVIHDYSDAKVEAKRATEMFAEALKPLDVALGDAEAEFSLLTQAQGASKEALQEYQKVAAIHASVDAKVAEATKSHRDELEQLTKELATHSNQNSFDAQILRNRIGTLNEEIAVMEGKGRRLKELETGTANLTEALKGEEKGEEKVAKAAEKSGDIVMSVEEQIAALREKVAAEQADRRAEVYSKESADALDGAAMMASIEEEQTRKHAEEVAKRLDQDKAAAEEQRAIQQAQLQSYGNLFGAISSLASSTSDAIGEKDKAAAKTAFAVSKAAGIAQAAVNAAMAVSEAVGSAPPPANIPAIIAAGVQGAASVAAVAAVPGPSFNDTPGVIRVGQGGGTQIGFAGGDYVAAAKSPDDLKRRVNGDMPFAESSPQSIRVGNRAFDFYMRDTLKANNRLSRSIRGSSRVGHRGR